MNMIALETSTDYCSLALLKSETLFERQECLPQKHEQILLIWLNESLQQAGLLCSDLATVAYSCGPGSFTGVRIGAALAQALTYAHQLNIFAIPTLQVIAQGVNRQFGLTHVIIVQDARINQAYYGEYRVDKEGIMQPVQPDRIYDVSSLPANTDISVVTNLEHLFERETINLIPQARDVLTLAEQCLAKNVPGTLDQALPIYLRTETAWKKSHSI